jgi:hypothetical protein
MNNKSERERAKIEDYKRITFKTCLWDSGRAPICNYADFEPLYDARLSIFGRDVTQCDSNPLGCLASRVLERRAGRIVLLRFGKSRRKPSTRRTSFLYKFSAIRKQNLISNLVEKFSSFSLTTVDQLRYMRNLRRMRFDGFSTKKISYRTHLCTYPITIQLVLLFYIWFKLINLNLHCSDLYLNWFTSPPHLQPLRIWFIFVLLLIYMVFQVLIELLTNCKAPVKQQSKGKIRNIFMSS